MQILSWENIEEIGHFGLKNGHLYHSPEIARDKTMESKLI